MSDPIPRFEMGTTKRFTITYSAAPVTAPVLTIHAGSNTGTYSSQPSVSGSQGTAADSGLIWTGYFTMPNSRQALYTYTWVASFTAGPVVVRDWFHVIGTIPG